MQREEFGYIQRAASKPYIATHQLTYSALALELANCRPLQKLAATSYLTNVRLLCPPRRKESDQGRALLLTDTSVNMTRDLRDTQPQCTQHYFDFACASRCGGTREGISHIFERNDHHVHTSNILWWGGQSEGKVFLEQFRIFLASLLHKVESLHGREHDSQVRPVCLREFGYSFRSISCWKLAYEHDRATYDTFTCAPQYKHAF